MDFQKIRKDVARRAYNAGYEISLLPSKCALGSMWFTGIRIHKDYAELTFDAAVNSFEYYNCCSELGYTARFYMEVSEYNKYTAR